MHIAIAIALASFLHGAIKAGVVTSTRPYPRDALAPDALHLLRSLVVAPALEELVYRWIPLRAFPHLPPGTTAVPFALVHVIDLYRTHPSHYPTTGQVIFRAVDTGIGGLAYEGAFRGAGGYPAAVLAHFAHNLGVEIGAWVAGGSPAPALRLPLDRGAPTV